VKELNDVGLRTYTSKTGKAIRDWFIIFRERRKFPNPLLEINCMGPPFLLAHPGTVKRMKEHGNSNLNRLTCDFMLDWLQNIEIPRLVKEQDLSEGDYLAQYHLSKVCRSTAHNWMLYVGFE
jgi:hypothetical protein